VSDLTVRAQTDSLRMRKERVQTTMLIELLSLLIFLAIAFAFVSKEESERTNPWKEKYDRIAMELQHRKAEIAKLSRDLAKIRAQVRFLEEANRLLRASVDGPLAANDKRIMLTAVQLESLNARLINSEALLQERQIENGQLRARLDGKGGTDLPRCAVAPGYLYKIEVSGADAYRVTANWPATAAEAVAKVTGAKALGQGRSLSRPQFEQLAAQVSHWGKTQSPQCGFTAVVIESHGNLTLYKIQQRTVGKYFYAAYR
jgi:hypothetical protein